MALTIKKGLVILAVSMLLLGKISSSHTQLKTNHPITYLILTTTLLKKSAPIIDNIMLSAMTLSNKRLKAVHHTKQLALYSSILGRASKFSILAKK